MEEKAIYFMFYLSSYIIFFVKRCQFEFDASKAFQSQKHLFGTLHRLTS